MKKEKLRIVRKQKGVTQLQLANVIATDVPNFSRKENGEVRIIQKEWDKIANFLDVSLEDIYEGDNPDLIELE